MKSSYKSYLLTSRIDKLFLKIYVKLLRGGNLSDCGFLLSDKKQNKKKM